MLKKLASRANWSAMATAAGTSIMTPIRMFFRKGNPSRSSSASASPTRALVSRNSSREAIIGNSNSTGCAAPARRMARSCVRNRSRRLNITRMPRQPRKGLASSPIST